MTIHRTMKGTLINVDEIRAKNEKAVSVGNMRVNARGDLLGPSGKILKTAQQRIQEENARKTTKVAKNVSLKSKHDTTHTEESITQQITKENIPQQKKGTRKKKETHLSDGSIRLDDINDIDGGL